VSDTTSKLVTLHLLTPLLSHTHTHTPIYTLSKSPPQLIVASCTQARVHRGEWEQARLAEDSVAVMQVHPPSGLRREDLATGGLTTTSVEEIPANALDAANAINTRGRKQWRSLISTGRGREARACEREREGERRRFCILRKVKGNMC
jgi:hypothetical protein